MINERILASYDNTKTIITPIFQDLNTKIKNKDISLPYTTQLSKSSYLKIDGNGNMFLNNDGKYIDLGNIRNDKLDIDKIYQIFSIVNQQEQWDTNPYANMPTARWGFGCVEYNGKVYCIGGANNNHLNNVEVYDILSNTWSSNYNVMPTARGSFACIEYNGKVYCIGGNNGGHLNKVEVYDILSNTWSSNYNVMPTGRSYFGCIEYNGKVYCIGGDNNSYLNNIEVYQLQYSHYDITLPLDISNKLSLLITNGDGTKLFHNNGTYDKINPTYECVKNEDIQSYLNELLK